jgi:hypothetical protein
MTELLYRCNCSKAEATFALGRDLVGKYEGRRCSRSDEDIITKLSSLLVEHLLKVAGESSWKVEDQRIINS